MRLERLTGDLIANLRSNIRYTLQDMRLSWIRPNSGKWTVQMSHGRSIVNYVFANQRTRRLIVESRVWEDDYIAGSDHRLLSCVVKPRPASPPTANFNAGDPKFPDGHCRIRKGDLKNPQLRTAAAREFKADRKQAKEMTIEQLGSLLYLGHASKREEVRRRLDAASSILKGCTSSSLAKGALNPKPVRCASSRPLWDHSLALEGGHKPSCGIGGGSLPGE